MLHLTKEECTREHRQTAPHSKINPPATLAYFAGTIFTFASAATNLVYGIAKGVTLPEQIVWGSVAVAASLALAIAPSAILSSLNRRAYGSAAVALLAAVVFGAFSLSAALGSATGGRLIAANEATNASNVQRIAAETYASAKAELERLAPARPTGELEAAITSILASDGRLSSAGDCSSTWLANSQLRAKCIEINKLRAELARAEYLTVLMAKLDRAAAAVTAPVAGPAKVANTDAIALHGFAQAFGMTVPIDTLNRLLVVLSVLVIEFGGGLAFALAGSLRASDTRPTYAETDCTNVPAPNPVQSPVQPVPTPSAPSVSNDPVRLMIADDTSERLIELLREKGGKVYGGQRMIARALNTSPASLNRVLRDLSGAGRVVVEAGSRGTVVRLAAAH